MSTTKLALIGIALAIGLVALLVWLAKSLQSKGAQTEDRAKSETREYQVREFNRYLGQRKRAPQVKMWAIVTVSIVVALWFVDPHAVTDNLKRLGPPIGVFLMGFGVIGVGHSMEAEHHSYTYSKLGWGAALILWSIAVHLLIKP